MVTSINRVECLAVSIRHSGSSEAGSADNGSCVWGGHSFCNAGDDHDHGRADNNDGPGDDHDIDDVDDAHGSI